MIGAEFQFWYRKVRKAFARDARALYSLRSLRFMAFLAIQKHKYHKVRKVPIAIGIARDKGIVFLVLVVQKMKLTHY